MWPLLGERKAAFLVRFGKRISSIFASKTLVAKTVSKSFTRNRREGPYADVNGIDILYGGNRGSYFCRPFDWERTR